MSLIRSVSPSIVVRFGQNLPGTIRTKMRGEIESKAGGMHDAFSQWINKERSDYVKMGPCTRGKNSNVIFSNPHDDETFTIDYSPPKRPEDMGIFYPSLEL